VKVRTYCPAFADLSAIDDKGFVELPEGANMNDLLKRLKLPFKPGMILLFRVNYEKAKLSTKLSDGDTVSFFAPLAGG
jgi:molybdopterin converting factor small subunit